MRNYNIAHAMDRYPIRAYDWYAKNGAPVSVLRALASQRQTRTYCRCSECVRPYDQYAVAKGSK